METFNIFQDSADHQEIIEGIIDWYRKLPKDYNDIATLLSASDRLAAAAYHMSKEAADHRFLQSRFEMKAKSAFVKKKLSYSKEDSVAKATARAEAETIEATESAKTYEALFQGERLILAEVDNVLGRMSQRLAIMRREYEMTRKDES